MQFKITALVPMRHHSERVPEKNYRPLAKKPLFYHILRNLHEVSEINQIVVNTDSSVITDGIREHFPEVLVLERPQHLRADDIPMNDILVYDTSQVDSDFYLQTHSTNPFLTPETILRSIQTLLSQYPTYDSLFSVTRLQTRLWDQLGRAINHNPEVLLRTQDLPPVYEENSCIYIFTRDTLIQRHNRLGYRPLMFPIDAHEALDIDEEIDFQIANLIMSTK